MTAVFKISDLPSIRMSYMLWEMAGIPHAC
jgi:hypothetical protein